ncbi:MAG: hypothetical protein ACOC2C_05910 [Cyclonatronaceae bacterium]
MIHTFTEENIEEIATVLGTTGKQNGKVFRFSIEPESEEASKTVLEVHVGVDVEGVSTNIVSVYAHNAFLQLHNCTAFIPSETLRQITFFGKMGGQTSGLILERSGAVSLYANVEDALLNSDFTTLPPEIMMSTVALSLTESVDFEGFSFDDDDT